MSRIRHIITGGSGFTGRVLTRMLLEKDEKVVNFDLAPPPEIAPPHAAQYQYIRGDVRRVDDLAKLNLDADCVVYHLAARQFADAVPRRNRYEWFDAVNVTGTANIVAVMQESGAHRLIFFSTDMTYGKPTSCPVLPTHPQNPLGPYGASKCKAERIIRNASTINATIFRPRLITGPGRFGILGKLFSLIKLGLPVPMIGSGKNRYQMVGVEDCAKAAIMALEAGCPSGPFNLGSKSPPTTRELLQSIIHHAHSRSMLIPIPSFLIKPVLALLDFMGLPLLYPEQYGIADLDVLLETSDTHRGIGWQPTYDDIDTMNAAYDAFVRQPSKAA